MPTIIKSDKYASANLGTAASFGVTMPFNLSTLAAEGIWSLRKVRNAYSGQLATVYQATTAAYGSLAFDPTGTLTGASVVTITTPGTSGYSVGQQVTLTAFAAAADVHFTQWNDQSGNGRHFVAAGVTSAPRLYISGVLQALGTKPCLACDGTNDYLSVSYNRSQPYSLVVAGQGAANGGINVQIDSVGNVGSILLAYTVNPRTFLYAGAVLGDNTDRTGVPHVIAGRFNGASSALYSDRSLVASGNGGTPAAATALYIGRSNVPTTYFANKYWEVLNYTGAATDLDAVSAALMTYYGL